MWAWIKREYAYFHSTFHDSEVILWARLNIFLGAIWSALQGVDVSMMHVFREHPEYLVYWIMFSNFVNEMLRRNREDWK